MKKYYVISYVLLMILWLGVQVAKIIYGGKTIVPFGWSIFIGAVLLNTVIAMTCFIVDMERGKI